MPGVGFAISLRASVLLSVLWRFPVWLVAKISSPCIQERRLLTLRCCPFLKVCAVVQVRKDLENHPKCTLGEMMFCLWETYSDLIISKLHFYLRHFI